MNNSQLHKPWSVSAEELKEEIDYISNLPQFQLKPGISINDYSRAMPKLAYWRIIRQKVIFMLIITELIFGAVALAGWFNAVEVEMSSMFKVIGITILIYAVLFGIVQLIYKNQLRKIIN